MDLIVLVALAVIITVTVVVVQRKQPRTPFNTPGQFTRAGHPSAHPSDAVQRWIALHDCRCGRRSWITITVRDME